MKPIFIRWTFEFDKLVEKALKNSINQMTIIL